MAGVSPYPIGGFQKQRFLAWLVTPPKDRDPKTMDELADELGVTRRTLTNWKTDDREFMEAWEKLYLRTIGNPERKQEIMNALLRTATDPDDPKHVQAAKAYFEIEGSLKPAKTEINMQMGDASKLPMEKLEELLSQKARDEIESRSHLEVVGDDD